MEFVYPTLNQVNEQQIPEEGEEDENPTKVGYTIRFVGGRRDGEEVWWLSGDGRIPDYIDEGSYISLPGSSYVFTTLNMGEKGPELIFMPFVPSIGTNA